MSVLVFGLNHKTAPIELRERFAFSLHDIEKTLSATSLDEVVILSTCNRVEFYVYGCSEEAIKQCLCLQKNIVFDQECLSHIYVLHGIDAVEHLMRVACGLDSLVLGEAEIFGQVKAAFSIACLHKTVGSYLSRLFRQTFHVAKQIRASTSIGACPVSVASAAIKYVDQSLNALARSPRILIIGAGNVGRLLFKHAQSLTPHVFIMSRQFVNAQRLANEGRGVAVELDELQAILKVVDVVISATSSKTILLSEKDMAHIVQPLLIVDLAVPRDIAPEVTRNANIVLCQLDELKNTVQHHVNMRQHAAQQAEKLIEEAAREFMLSLRTLDSDEIIKQYRARMESQCGQVLEKFSHHSLTQEDLKSFSHNLLNKIMHLPSIQLRQASFEGRDDLLKSASEIFGI